MKTIQRFIESLSDDEKEYFAQMLENDLGVDEELPERPMLYNRKVRNE